MRVWAAVVQSAMHLGQNSFRDPSVPEGLRRLRVNGVILLRIAVASFPTIMKSKTAQNREGPRSVSI